MADPETTPPVADPYDLGDTSEAPFQQASQTSLVQELPPPVETPGPSAPAAERPRNADGTFAKPANLVEVARSFGYSDSDIDELTTAQLNADCLRLTHKQNTLRSNLAAERTAQDAQVRAPAPERAKPQADEDEEALDALEKEGFDPRLSKVVRKVLKENKQLRSELGGIAQREQLREERTTAEVIDGAFEAMEQAALFGEGAIEDLGETAEGRRRLAVVRMANIDLKKDNATTIRRKVKQTAKELFGGSEPAKKKAEETPYDAALGKTNGKPAKRITKEQWNDAATQKPTNREGSDLPPGDEKAIKGVKARLGADADAEPDSTTMDGFFE